MGCPGKSIGYLRGRNTVGCGGLGHSGKHGDITTLCRFDGLLAGSANGQNPGLQKAFNLCAVPTKYLDGFPGFRSTGQDVSNERGAARCCGPACGTVRLAWGRHVVNDQIEQGMQILAWAI